MFIFKILKAKLFEFKVLGGIVNCELLQTERMKRFFFKINFNNEFLLKMMCKDKNTIKNTKSKPKQGQTQVGAQGARAFPGSIFIYYIYIYIYSYNIFHL